MQPTWAWYWRALRREAGTALLLGMGCGIVVGLIVWIFWPSRPGSRWKLQGPIPRRGGKTIAELRADQRRHKQG